MAENLSRIFLVEEDDDTRSLLKQNLVRYGYQVIVALDEADALERIGMRHVHVDLLLLDLVNKSTDEALDVGRRIRAHAHYDEHTPLVVMAEKYGPDVEGTDVNVRDNDWITYLEDPGQLRNLLARLINRPTGQHTSTPASDTGAALNPRARR